MTNMYIEINKGYVMDVTKNAPKPIFFNTKTILKGGDSVEVSNIDGEGIRVVRMKGKEVKFDKVIKEDGVYIIMPFFVKKINRMSSGHRKVYGMLRQVLDENFYLEDSDTLTKPFSIELKIEMDVVLKHKYIVKINSSLMSKTHVDQIKRLVDKSIEIVDVNELYNAVKQDMNIVVIDEVLNAITRLVAMKNTRMVV